MNTKKRFFITFLIIILINLTFPLSKAKCVTLDSILHEVIKHEESLRSIKPVNYKIFVKISKNNMDIEANLYFISEKDNLKKIVFSLDSDFNIKEVLLNGNKLRFGTHGGDVRAILSKPLKKDEIYELTVRYSYTIAKDKEIVELNHTNYWYPQVYPKEFYKVNLNITVPKNYTAVTSGELKSVKEVGEFKNYEYETSEIHRFLNLISGRFAVKTTKHENINIEVYYPEKMKNLQIDIDEVLAFCEYTLDIYKKKFSLVYPSNYLRVVFLPYGTTPYINSDVVGIYNFYLHNPIVNPKIEFYYTLAHEIAHRWFGHRCGLNLKGPGTLFLTEGFAVYLGHYVISQEYKSFIDDRFMYGRLWEYYLLSNNKIRHKNPVAYYVFGGGEDAVAAAVKSALCLRMLSYLIGEKNFAEILNLYTMNNSYKFPTMEDFKNAVKEVVGNKLDWFFNVFIESTQEFDIGISDVTIEKEKDHYLTSFTITQNMDTVKIENYKVLLISKKTSYFKNISLTNYNQTFKFKTKDKITSIYLDPELCIFDTNPDNNFWSKGTEDLNKALEKFKFGKHNKSLKFFKSALEKDPHIFTLHYPEIREVFLLNKKSKEFNLLLEKFSRHKAIKSTVENAKNQIKYEEEKGFIKSWAVYKPDGKEIDFDKEETPLIKPQDTIRPYEDNTYGIFNFKYIFPEEKSYIVYALISAYSDYERKIHIEFGSEARAKIYFNNKYTFIKEDRIHRSIYPEIIPINLKKGENKIILKFHIKYANTRFIFRLLDENYKLLRDILYSTKIREATITGNL